MSKILITGSSGFLGWNLAQIAQKKWEVYGTYYAHLVNLPGVTLFKVDLTNYQAVKNLLIEISPSAIIHTAAQSKPNFCQEHPAESYIINVTSSLNLANLCAERDIPYIFTSTDLVFNGLNPPYRETDAVSPINYYGEQKVLAEQGILARYPKSAICRMPLMFGLPAPTSNSFIQPFIKTLREGKALSLFVDEFRTPVSASTAATGLLLAFEKKFAGILHLGGRESISRYQFGCLLADILEVPITQIKSCQQKDFPMPAPRSPNVSLDSSQAFALGYQPLSIRQEIFAFLSLS